MPLAEEVTDSTDWINTALASFASLDAALRCQVCKDFYNTPMITSCSHTFCSLCIRQCLSADGKCPTCRQGDQSSRLRRNWTVQEVVESFASARPQGLQLARKTQQEREEDELPKKKRRRVDTNPAPVRETRQTRSSGRRGANNVVPSQETPFLDTEDEDIEEYQPSPEPEPAQPKDGLVACPMCNKRMKEELVFTHLDRCTQDNDDNSIVSKSRYLHSPTSNT
jgi:E3 ubiquitin-protein ligase RAD18